MYVFLMHASMYICMYFLCMCLCMYDICIFYDNQSGVYMCVCICGDDWGHHHCMPAGQIWKMAVSMHVSWVDVYVYVCMYVCICDDELGHHHRMPAVHVCMYMCMYVCVCMYVFVRTIGLMYMCMYVCMYSWWRLGWSSLHACRADLRDRSTYACIYVYVCVCMYVFFMHVCMHVFLTTIEMSYTCV